MMKPLSVISVLLICVALSHACNEGLCASRVSKCLLIKACECNMNNKKNCTCCRDCHMCLSQLYSECCSCVGLCRKPRLGLSPNASTIEDLPEPIPDLFDVLTEEADPLDRWAVFTYPALSDPRFISNDHSLHIVTANDDVKQFSSTLNCSVAYMAQCFSLNKCKDACMSMGASRMRWFHEDGCCQCVSHTCRDYGLNKPKCRKCPDRELTSGPAAHVINLENTVDHASTRLVDENDIASMSSST